MVGKWQTVRLGEYVEKIGSGSTPLGGSGVYLDSGLTSLIRSQNVYNDGFNTNGLVFISEEEAQRLKGVSVETGDILLNITGDSVARVCMAPTAYLPARVNQHVAIIRVIPEVFDARFVRYFLSSPVTQELLLTLASAGATRNALTKGLIEKLEVPKPEIAEQRAIANVLSSLDNKIALNRQINQTLEQIAQAIFQSWFVDFEPVKAKIAARAVGRDPLRAAMCAISGKIDAELDELPSEQFDELAATAALFPEELIESELGEIPKGWTAKKITDIISRLSAGKKYDQKSTTITGRVPVLDQGKSGIIGYHDNNPDVIASMDDPIIVFANHTCYMRLVMFEFSAIQNVLPFKGNGINIYWTYLATLEKQPFIEYKGHWPDFIINSVVVPSPQLAQHFGTLVKPIFLAAWQRQVQTMTLTDLRDSLLPKLLSGELSVDGEEPTPSRQASPPLPDRRG